ncbi:MAG: HDOD domain-containing protein [Gammaproteobacteria bacterium]|nr:HDOD domain-containing protein [Gammaproteobacteria bacterium]
MTVSIQEYSKRDQLSPINELADSDRQLLFNKSKLIEVEPRTLITKEEGVLTFLLEGEVTVLTSGFISERFTHLESRALNPLFNSGLDEDSVLFTSYGVILEIDQKLCEGLLLQNQADSIEQTEIEFNQYEEELFDSLYSTFKQGRLELPVLPEAALKIRQAVNSGDATSQEIISFVQTDAVLSARLLKVANSPLYGTWREIKTIKDAVRRLGLEVTRNLCFSLSVHQLYHARTNMIKNEMNTLFSLTRRISSMAYGLTKEFCDDLDPEQTVLCGLLQGLGALPILQYIDSHPYLAQNPAQLKSSILKLNVPISILLFNEWHFDPTYISYIENAENWTRDTGDQLDYCDILIAARLLCYYESGNIAKSLPPMEKIPVINKLGILDHYASLEVYLKHAKEDISSMDGLLR